MQPKNIEIISKFHDVYLLIIIQGIIILESVQKSAQNCELLEAKGLLSLLLRANRTS